MAVYQELSGRQVRIKDPELCRKQGSNRAYMMRLTSENLIRNYLLEAGLYTANSYPEDAHGGWESPVCQLRGHFTGHWLSAAAMIYHGTGDQEIKAKADALVAKLGECQERNGGEWAASIPEKYLYWIAQGKQIWAPQYTIHKTLMGLVDMYELAGNQQALEIADRFGDWFLRWSTSFSREEFDKILDFETGGLLEVWAQMLQHTGKEKYRTLMERYYRSRLFDPLLEGKDMLSDRHANTTIPEILGCARAYEVTGEERWRKIAEAYWKCAVEGRDSYATGGNTCGEVWNPPGSVAERLGLTTQEHCTVYNMMRLADYLFRWTGESKYADYWEKNLYNGIMAQGYWQGYFFPGQKVTTPRTGLLLYYLPMRPGSVKPWASETQHFFCCHGTLVQANASFNRCIYYQKENELRICQYLDSEVDVTMGENTFTLTQYEDTMEGLWESQETSPQTSFQNSKESYKALNMVYKVKAEKAFDATLSFRIPAWIQGDMMIQVNGQSCSFSVSDGFAQISRTWNPQDEIRVQLPKAITCVASPDRPDMVAFLDGPVVLAGLCSEERTLYAADPNHPESILTPANTHEWRCWGHTYKTRDQDAGMRFIPLYEVGYENYSIYFPIRPLK